MAALRIQAASLLGLALLSGPLWAARQGSDPTGVEAFASLAGVLAKLESGLAPETAAQRVHALGSSAAPLLLAALSRDELPLAGGSLALGEREHGVLLQGARQMGREAFVADNKSDAIEARAIWMAVHQGGIKRIAFKSKC